MSVNVPFSSGTRDLLVLPELNALNGVWPEDMAVEADVRDMPGVWLSADHQVCYAICEESWYCGVQSNGTDSVIAAT